MASSRHDNGGAVSSLTFEAILGVLARSTRRDTKEYQEGLLEQWLFGLGGSPLVTTPVRDIGYGLGLV